MRHLYSNVHLVHRFLVDRGLTAAAAADIRRIAHWRLLLVRRNRWRSHRAPELLTESMTTITMVTVKLQSSQLPSAGHVHDAAMSSKITQEIL